MVVARSGECLRAGAEQAGATVEIKVERLYETFRVDAADPMVRWAEEATRSCGLEPVIKDGGGGSDANVFNAHGLKAVVLGVGYQEIHSHSEWIAVADLAKAAERTAALIQLIGSRAHQGELAPPLELSGR